MSTSYKLTGVSQFNAAIQKFAKATEEAPHRIAIKLMLDLLSKTVSLSPVDTGRLVGAWQVSTTPIPSFGVNKYDDGVSRKSQEAAIKRDQIARNEDKALAFTGGTIWLANNIDYVEFREFGTPYSSGDYMLSQAIRSTTAMAVQLAREAME